MIVEYCDYNLEWDKNTKNIHTVGTGTGVFITAGKAVPITWEKADYWEKHTLLLSERRGDHAESGTDMGLDRAALHDRRDHCGVVWQSNQRRTKEIIF